MGIPVEPIALGEGDEMPPSTAGPLTVTDLVRYAGAGGDFNPIHHDEGFARQAGQPGVFAMGLLHAGMLGFRLARWVGPLNIRTYTVRFTGQVWPGDELRFTGRVTTLVGDRADLELEVTRQTDDVALRATASVTVSVAA